MNELLNFMTIRSEFSGLTDYHKRLLARYVRVYYRETLPGRGLAYACMAFNRRYDERAVHRRFTNAFINWLYYY